ncbi:MAG: hypothetical protein D6741_19055, partial [Planctomycetota bacterium]
MFQAGSLAKDESAQLTEARRAFTQGDWDRSLELARRAAEKNSDLLCGEVFVTRLLFESGEFAAGKAVLERAAIERPDDPDVFWTLGDLALYQARLADAWVLYHHALDLLEKRSYSDFAAQQRRRFLLRGCAKVAELRRDWARLQQVTAQWLALVPDDGEALRSAARAEFEQGDSAEATKKLQAALQTQQDAEPISLTLWRWAREDNQPEKANAYVNQALKDSPDDSRVVFAAAMWRSERGNRDEALSLLERVKTANRVNVDAIRLRSALLLADGKYESAERDARQALSIVPSDIGARGVLAIALAASYDSDAHEESKQ